MINFGKATRPLWLLPVGLVYFALYYGLFSAAIRYFNLKTPGREAEADTDAGAAPLANSRGEAFVVALGGTDNLATVDACTTRLRLVLVNGQAADEKALRALGARGLVRPSANALQVVLGPVADQVAAEIRAAMPTAPRSVQPSSAIAPVISDGKGTAVTSAVTDTHALLRALGGPANVLKVETCSSRLRVSVVTSKDIDAGKLKALGVRGLVMPNADSVHLVIGPSADAVAVKLRAELR